MCAVHNEITNNKRRVPEASTRTWEPQQFLTPNLPETHETLWGWLAKHEPFVLEMCHEAPLIAAFGPYLSQLDLLCINTRIPVEPPTALKAQGVLTCYAYQNHILAYVMAVTP